MGEFPVDKAMPSGGGRRIELDFLRGIALLWIMLGHYIGIVGLDIFKDNVLVKLLWQGVHFPVYVFLIISGYFLAQKAYLTENGDINLMRSLGRIVPGYILFLMLFFIFNLAAPSEGYLSFKNNWIVNGPKSHLNAIIKRSQGQVPGIKYYVAYVGNRDSQLLEVITDPKHDLPFIRITDMPSQRTYLYGKVSSVFDADAIEMGSSTYIPMRYPKQFRYKYKPAMFLPYLGLFQNYTNKIFLLHHTWFFAFLIHFYIIFWAVLRLIRKVASTDRSRLRLFGLLVIFGIITEIILRALNPSWVQWKTHMIIDIPLYGSLVAMLEMRYRERLENIFLRMFTFATGFGLVMAVIFYEFQQHQTFAAIGVALIVLSVINADVKLFERLKGFSASIAWIGRKSLTPYLWHWTLGHAFAVLFCNFLDLNAYVSLAFMFASMVILVVCADKIFMPLYRKFGYSPTVVK